MNNLTKKIGTFFGLALLLALLLALSLGSCSGKKSAIIVKEGLKSHFVTISPEEKNENLHIFSWSTNPKKIAESGLIKLFIDEKTYAVTVKEELSEHIWYSLPHNVENDLSFTDYQSAVVRLEVVDGYKTYMLNSQDNSVAFGTVTYEPIIEETGGDSNTTSSPLGVKVNYVMAQDATTARKNSSDYTPEDIAFKVTVSYILKDGSLYVDCEYENLVSNDAYIRELGLLEDFGASTSPAEKDFFLLPDKSGALMFLARDKEKEEEKVFRVYGDENQNEEGGELPAIIGAYAIKNEGGVCAVIIQKGEALAKIRAYKKGTDKGLNKVGASFEITQVKDVEASDGSYTRYIGKNFYKDGVRLCMRFQPSVNANYPAIAAVFREQLIRDGFLSSKSLKKTEDIPLNITLIGAAKNRKFAKLPIEFLSSITNFDQAKDMVSRVKSKGVNKVSIKYSGALSGGLSQRDALYAKPMMLLGGKKDLAQLADYCQKQKFDLFLGVDLFSFSQSDLKKDSGVAKAIDGEKSEIQAKNPLSHEGENYLTKQLRTASSLSKASLKILSNTRKIGATGFSVGDAGYFVYSDHSGNGMDRQSIVQEATKQIKALSTDKKIMVDKGNFYTMKNASFVSCLPTVMEPGDIQKDSYVYVPFVQMILHGNIDYSVGYINKFFSENDSVRSPKELEFSALNGKEQKALKDIMLKNIEYGACPSYIWTYKKLHTPQGNVETFYYDDWINQAADYYSKANRALAEFRDLRIINHSQLGPDVFCTEFEGGRFIYVNYSFEDFPVGSLIIKARDFLKI
ncbi:MAG TPA: DUF5696 domain-containing protein [Oscillospiraceae bacterium]|nr:DUF5696 domain-containing protein [Oscillospiraceae bacterium]